MQEPASERYMAGVARGQGSAGTPLSLNDKPMDQQPQQMAAEDVHAGAGDRDVLPTDGGVEAAPSVEAPGVEAAPAAPEGIDDGLGAGAEEGSRPVDPREALLDACAGGMAAALKGEHVWVTCWQKLLP